MNLDTKFKHALIEDLQFTYNFPFFDVVEEDEIAEHSDEAEEPESSHNVDHRVLQVKFSLL